MRYSLWSKKRKISHLNKWLFFVYMTSLRDFAPEEILAPLLQLEWNQAGMIRNFMVFSGGGVLKKQLALGWKLRRYHENAQAPKSHLAKSNFVFHDQMENGSCREKSSRGSVVNQWTFYGVFNNDGSPTLYFIDLTFFVRHDIICNRYNTVIFKILSI